MTSSGLGGDREALVRIPWVQVEVLLGFLALVRIPWVQVEVLLGFLGRYLISRSSSGGEGGYQDQQGGAGDNGSQEQGGDG